MVQAVVSRTTQTAVALHADKQRPGDYRACLHVPAPIVSAGTRPHEQHIFTNSASVDLPIPPQTRASSSQHPRRHCLARETCSSPSLTRSAISLYPLQTG